MSPWPRQRPADLNAFYGNPDTNSDGSPDAAWEAAHIVRLTPPYRMVLAWDPARTVSAIRIHGRCAESLERVLEGILAHYGSQAAVERARLHLYGGAYAFRVMRGGHSLSVHSWGAAIDLDPARNAFGRRWSPDAGMMPERVVDLFAAEGWTFGGRWGKPDAMHFQAADI